MQKGRWEVSGSPLWLSHAARDGVGVAAVRLRKGGLSLQSVVVFVLQRQELQELLKTRCSREKAAGLAHVLQTPQATGRALDAH